MTNEGGTNLPVKGRRSLFRRILLVCAILIGIMLLVGVAGTFWVRGMVMASLPQLDGSLPVTGLVSSVRIERDAQGVPTIHATNRLDLARATGFLHGQDRFFQMDLLRRQSAGELAELFGPTAIGYDKQNRLHRFRAHAAAILETLSDLDTRLLQIYTEGVNTGLRSLGSNPPEYLALRVEPTDWHPEDSVLVLYSMYLELQGDNGRREAALGCLHDLYPQELFDFLAPRGTEWDAPLVGESFPSPAIPGPEMFDLRTETMAAAVLSLPSERASEPDPLLIPGSNNWAVSGNHSASGAALLANDMHLGHDMPNIWYRNRFIIEGDDPSDHMLDITGVTLPGMPPMITGSNGRIAWGFTNSQIDTHDLVIVEIDPADENRYLTAEGPLPFEQHTETIRAKSGETGLLEIRSTIWGPIVAEDHRGRPLALRWLAYELMGVNLGLFQLEQAADLEEAIGIANRIGMPTQNFTVADSTGRIGWSLAGPIPRRVGLDGRLPQSWADGNRRWEGRLNPADYPRVTDPESGRIWTANNRVVGGDMLQKLGDGGYSTGARAGQIRDGLFALERADVGDMLAIQLDDRALFLERWHDLLLETLDDRAIAGEDGRGELRRLVEADWSGHASVESVAYRMVRAFRLFLAERVFNPLTAKCSEADPIFDFMRIGQWEEPLWRLITERPLHLLDPQYENWEEQLLAAVDAVVEFLYEDPDTSPEQRTWGARNTVRIQHPISRAIPQLSHWLDIPPEPLPGDSHMPRVQSMRFGASERMVVSPGHEEEGIFHMPAGQSGHPWSPFYRRGHEAWARGEATPFLPGSAVHELVLQPGE
jgi:penicillin amidase